MFEAQFLVGMNKKYVGELRKQAEVEYATYNIALSFKTSDCQIAWKLLKLNLSAHYSSNDNILECTIH